MERKGFEIGDGDWMVVVLLDIWPEDLGEVYAELREAGAERWRAEEACGGLEGWNRGYTFTDYMGRVTVVCVGRARGSDELFDTIQHETRHAADHIGKFFGIEARGEESAYLQGELAKQMWVAAAVVLCPRCGVSRANTRYT